MLLFVAAEEQGLIGSQYFAEHPPIPAGRMAANVNYDSGNIWGETRDITFIGFGKSSLDAVAGEVAAQQARTVVGDQLPDRGYYYRSDQFNFAKIGVPAFYFDARRRLRRSTGRVGHASSSSATRRDDYHQRATSSTPEWSFDGMVQDARFGFTRGCIVANDDPFRNGTRATNSKRPRLRGARSRRGALTPVEPSALAGGQS